MLNIPINEFVVPVVEAIPGEPYARVTRYRGTGFFVGSRGAVLTAAHVVDNADEELAVAVPTPAGGSRLWSLQGVERHPTEDIAVGIADLAEAVPKSPLRVTREPQFGSAQWMLWGYPEDIMYDLVVGGTAVLRSELVFVSGYVRRRVPQDVEIPQVRGRALYECGGLAGPGCSGSPMILTNQIQDRHWPMFGLYVGERIASDRGLFVSYAVRMDDVLDWSPRVLGRPLDVESQT